MSKFNTLTPVAQSFIEHLVTMGKPETWVSPYRLSGSAFTNFTTGRAYKGGMNAFLMTMHGGTLYAGKKQGMKAGLVLENETDCVLILRPILKAYYKDNPDTGKKERNQYCSGFAFVRVFAITAFKDTPKRAELIKKYEESDAEVTDLSNRQVYDDLLDKIGKLVTVVSKNQRMALSYLAKKEINMPKLENLTSIDTAVRILFHETAHAMTHFGATRGDTKGEEEGIAEISSMIMAAEFGYPIDMTNTSAYIWSWLGLKDNWFGYNEPKHLDDLKPEEQTAVIMIRGIFQKAQKRLGLLKALFRELEAAA